MAIDHLLQRRAGGEWGGNVVTTLCILVSHAHAYECNNGYVFSGMTMKSVGLAAMTMVRASLRPSPAAAAVCLTAPLCR